MASPFPTNATFIFQVPVGDTTEDELGNALAQTDDLVVTAYVREQRQRGGGDQGLERDRASTTLTGRCIDPPILPPSVLPGAIAQATVGNLKGTFTLDVVPQSAFEAVTEALGEKIRGEFVATTVWGQVR